MHSKRTLKSSYLCEEDNVNRQSSIFNQLFFSTKHPTADLRERVPEANPLTQFTFNVVERTKTIFRGNRSRSNSYEAMSKKNTSLLKSITFKDRIDDPELKNLTNEVFRSPEEEDDEFLRSMSNLS